MQKVDPDRPIYDWRRRACTFPRVGSPPELSDLCGQSSRRSGPPPRQRSSPRGEPLGCTRVARRRPWSLLCRVVFADRASPLDIQEMSFHRRQSDGLLVLFVAAGAKGTVPRSVRERFEVMTVFVLHLVNYNRLFQVCFELRVFVEHVRESDLQFGQLQLKVRQQPLRGCIFVCLVQFE